jgi:acetolactate synthase-1/2/3 large subunit
MNITGAQIVTEVLCEQGCDTVFGYPGGQVIDLYDALWLAKDRIRHVLTAHEQGAAHAADGYARASGKVGVVIATSGPGATNLVTGLATAHLDSVPLVAVTGNVPSGLIGRDAFQEVDIVGVSMPVTKHNFIVKDVTRLAETLRLAFKIAKSGRPGPVLVDIPKDVQTASCEFEPAAAPIEAEPKKTSSNHRLRWAKEMIEKSRRPYIYFGGGIISGDASAELLAFAERCDAPMGCSLMGLSAVPTDHPRFLGMQGMHGHFAASAAEQEADLVIALGVRFSDRATGDGDSFAERFRVLHIDIDAAELNKNIHAQLSVQGDVKDALSRLTEILPQQHHPTWMKRIRTLRREEAERTAHSHEMRDARSGLQKGMGTVTETEADRHFLLPPGQSYDTSPCLTHEQIIDGIEAAKAGSCIAVTDVGQHQMWAAQRCHLTVPRCFLTSGGLGTMGFGLGAAVGAYIATGRRPVLFTGDGCFRMNLTELATAVAEKVPVVIVIFNNGVLGMVRQWQTLFFDGHHSATTLPRTADFVKIAEGFGAGAMRAHTPEELKAAAETAFAQEMPFVIDCITDPDETVLPMLPPGGSFADLITEI